MEISPRHKAALEWAANGCPVFPCVVGGKEPAVAGGFKAATTDSTLINAWWSEADYNLAICPEDCGWGVIELDTYKPAWCAASDDVIRNLPSTYTIESPSGGRHLYFEGSLPPSVNKLAPAIDTRGVGSYVLIPPSVVGGKPYKVIDARDPVLLPDFIQARIAAKDTRRAADDGDLDRPGGVARARSFLADLERRDGKPVDGCGSDDAVFRAACWVLGLGNSQEKCCELLAESWCNHFDADWIAQKVENAVQYRQNEGSVDASPDFTADFSTLPAVAAALAESAKAPVKRSKFYPLDETEQDAQKDPVWLIKDLLQEQSTVMLMGQSRALKSFIAVDVALSIASGVAWHGSVPSVRGAVIYAAAEGARGLKKRRQAWKALHGIETAPGFYVTASPFIAIDAEVQEFGDAIRARLQPGEPIGLIVIDTTSKAMAGLNENDVKDANRFVIFCESLRDAFGCSVLAIHHQGKSEDKFGRGSSAFFQGFDTFIEVKRPIDNIPAVEMWVRKHKDGAEPEEAWFFEGQEIAGSLALVPLDKKDYLALTKGEDQFEPKKVGAALVAIRAFGQQAGVTTQVLAAELCPMTENDGPERHMEKVARIVKSLRALSRGKLAGYTEGEGRTLTWCLPAPEATND